jgi:hypothetical protein
MSPENVEVVRRLHERLNLGDIEGVIELCEPEFFLDMSERVFNPGNVRGP